MTGEFIFGRNEYLPLPYVDDYNEYLRQHVDDPRRLRPGGTYTSVDAKHEVIKWDGPTWTADDLTARPGTPCADYGSHLFIQGVCADCGLRMNP